MMADTNQKALFELVKAGLWEKSNDNHNLFEDVDWGEVYRLAEEQSVIGLLTSGIEAVSSADSCRDSAKSEQVHFAPTAPKVQDLGSRVPQEWALQFLGQSFRVEQRNKAMNAFVARLIEQLREAGIYVILVKGQGIAQCYERPLWRACGDVDLLLSEENYEKAKALLLPLASDVETEYTHFKHQGMTIDGWVVELHGTLHSRLSARVDRMIDGVQEDVFCGGKVRSWMNGRTQVFLPAPDEDVIFVFTHILHHFFFEGVGLRQICDWCRLLYTYRDTLNVPLLESRLKKAGLMSEWKAFAAFAVEYLGMPVEAMPFYDNGLKYKVQGSKICEFIMEVGNFGCNQRRDYSGMSYIKRKFISSWGRLSDMLRHFQLFPLDSIRFFSGVLRSGLHAAVRGE